MGDICLKSLFYPYESLSQRGLCTNLEKGIIMCLLADIKNYGIIVLEKNLYSDIFSLGIVKNYKIDQGSFQTYNTIYHNVLFINVL